VTTGVSGFVSLTPLCLGADLNFGASQASAMGGGRNTGGSASGLTVTAELNYQTLS